MLIYFISFATDKQFRFYYRFAFDVVLEVAVVEFTRSFEADI